MIKQALRDSTLYALAAIFSRSIIVLQVPLFAHALSPADFGTADLLTVLVVIVNFFVGLEISQAVAIFYSEPGKESERKLTASTALWFLITSYLIFSLLALPFSGRISQLLFDSDLQSELVRIAIFIAFAQALQIITQNQLRWMLKAKAFLVVNILGGALNLGLSSYLILSLGLGVQGLLYGQLISCLLSAAIAVLYANGEFTLSFSSSKFKEMAAFSIPLVLSSVTGYLAMYVDRICIKEMISLEAVGIYGVAFRFASVVGAIIAGFSGAVSPLVYSRRAEKDTPGQIATLFRISLFMGLCMVLFLGLFSDVIYTLFSSPDFYRGHRLLPILAASLLLSFGYTFSPGLALAKKSKVIALLSLVTMIANLALNIVLIPYLGITGSAIATLASSALSFYLWFALGQKNYFVPISWLRPIFACLATFAITFPLYNSVLQSISDHLAVKTFIFLAGAIILSLILAEKKDALKFREVLLRQRSSKI